MAKSGFLAGGNGNESMEHRVTVDLLEPGALRKHYILPPRTDQMHETLNVGYARGHRESIPTLWPSRLIGREF
jgi:hypothetical protein